MAKRGGDNLTIRRLVRDDLAAVERAMPFGGTDKHAQRLRLQAAGEATYLVAWQGQRPVGHGFIQWRPTRSEYPQLSGLRDCPDLEDLMVLEEYRGRGIGTALLTRSLALARRRGFRRFGLSVGVTDNPRARALYERMGFVNAGIEPYEEQYDFVDAAGRPQRWREICVYLVKALDTRGR
ncbi:MAG: GNAT family N-acetyltransferase [Planctomycetota bacterium]